MLKAVFLKILRALGLDVLLARELERILQTLSKKLSNGANRLALFLSAVQDKPLTWEQSQDD